MKAAVYIQYGLPGVLQVKQVENPIPQKNEVLVRIKATAVNSGDIRLRKADPFAVRFIFGLIKPKINILGCVFSGEVESVGEDVKLFKVGDFVFGHTNMRFGSYAEYLCIRDNASIALKPANISHKEAAVIPFGGVTALHFIKKVKIKPGQKVLVVGASGAVGSAAVQLAKSFGADKVIDYTKEDFNQTGETYDIIFDTVKAISVSRSMKSLNKTGTMILSAAGMLEMLLGLWISIVSKKKIMAGVISHKAADLIFLKELIATEKFKPVIDKTYSLEQIAEAHAYVEKGHKKGNVAIEV
jgi:NADPH:quinone reductase-like Zn-dependent oxidoreductase